jgi:hypothetical protein
MIHTCCRLLLELMYKVLKEVKRFRTQRMGAELLDIPFNSIHSLIACYGLRD